MIGLSCFVNYFHDSELKEINYDWNTFTLVLTLNISLDGPCNTYQQSILKFIECSFFEVPHNSPWGDSSYINGANQFQSNDKEISAYSIDQSESNNKGENLMEDLSILYGLVALVISLLVLVFIIRSAIDGSKSSRKLDILIDEIR
ncbi:hypothetical protein [Paenibacillus wynnii]|uniref:Uncharacterized protein n=1 Tax=Paenibacillus wynnii TaxID=268407 RepID=A0A098M768_9BACL|nr:hypothetical protein [Paenibacillus wynnii]KGE18409.1 hypothetical protein PWYN_28310 [Paenibacillus wynnii]